MLGGIIMGRDWSRLTCYNEIDEFMNLSGAK